MANLKNGTSIGGYLALHTGNIGNTKNINTLTVQDWIELGDGTGLQDRGIIFNRGATDWMISADSSFLISSGTTGDWDSAMQLTPTHMYLYSNFNGPADVYMEVDESRMELKNAGSTYFSVSTGGINAPALTTVGYISSGSDITEAGTKLKDKYAPIGSYGSGSTATFDGISANINHENTGTGVSLYGSAANGSFPAYGIAFAGTANGGTHGGVTSDWATYLTMNDSTNRGWIFRRGSTNVASIAGTGIITAAQLTVGNSWFGQNHAYNTAEIRGYGSELMIGSQGTQIHINYRTCNGGTANHTPTAWYWRAGTSSNWSDHQFGHVTAHRRMYANDGIQLGTDRSVYFDGGTTYYLREGTGSFGTVAAYGRKSGWSGYSIEGRTVFMHDGADASGIYNDVDNEWMFLAYRNGESRMYGNGVQRITANTTGAAIAGALVATGNVTAYSDMRLKDKIAPFTRNITENIAELDVFYYTMKADGHKGIGVSAQQIKALWPEFVTVSEDEINTLSVDYGKLGTAIAINGVKELKAEIEELKKEIRELKTK